MTIHTPTIVEISVAELKVVLSQFIETNTKQKFFVENAGFVQNDKGESVLHCLCTERKSELHLPS